jgi:hypothetical protein
MQKSLLVWLLKESQVRDHLVIMPITKPDLADNPVFVGSIFDLRSWFDFILVNHVENHCIRKIKYLSAITTSRPMFLESAILSWDSIWFASWPSHLLSYHLQSTCHTFVCYTTDGPKPFIDRLVHESSPELSSHLRFFQRCQWWCLWSTEQSSRILARLTDVLKPTQVSLAVIAAVASAMIGLRPNGGE